MENFDYNDYIKNNPLLKENLEGVNESDVKPKWSSLSDDDRIDLLTGVWDDSDEAEKHFEKSWDDLPEAAKENMRMDMLSEGEPESEGDCACEVVDGECQCDDKEITEVDVEGEAGPVVDKFYADIMKYFNRNHDEIYDMNNFLTALKHVTTTVTATRDKFADKTGFDGLDEDVKTLNEDASSLFREKQMVMKQLLGDMQQIASENPEELTHDFLNKIKDVIDELMITDF